MKADIQKSRAAALLLALCLIAVFSLSALFVVSHADHDCTGTECAVCHEIHSCLNWKSGKMPEFLRLECQRELL